MSLYDDVDVKTRATENVSGWSSGIKLLQSQLQLKKATNTQSKKEQRKVSLAPVIDLKSKQRDDDDIYQNYPKPRNEPSLPTLNSSMTYGVEYDWNVEDEYDPLWPNEFDKVVKELRDQRDRENDKEAKRRERRRKSRFSDPEEPPEASATPQMMAPPLASGFAGRWADDEDEIMEPPSPASAATVQPGGGAGPSAKSSRPSGGAAIAPPPSLQEPPAGAAPAEPLPVYPGGKNFGSSSVAAKIMARYGFKEGQGLGKQEQGMSSALQVEKTSKRGGRIIHEKELLLAQQAALAASAASGAAAAAAAAAAAGAPAAAASAAPAASSTTPSSSPFGDRGPMGAMSSNQPSITEIIKNPSKVVLLKNMVGPGEVDDDLEPEVVEECNTKYGEVTSVLIHETGSENPEEGVRIFMEFRRIESAIKAVVDLNGRFFGGRQVKANFYDPDKYDNLQLMD